MRRDDNLPPGVTANDIPGNGPENMPDHRVVLCKGQWGMLTLPVPAYSECSGNVVNLEFRGLFLEEKDALTAFFRDTARGMKEQWTYTDSIGDKHMARFDNPVLVFV